MGIRGKHIIWPIKFPSPICHRYSLQAANTYLPILSMDTYPTINNMQTVKHKKHFGEVRNSSSPLQDLRLSHNACFISLWIPASLPNAQMTHVPHGYALAHAPQDYADAYLDSNPNLTICIW